MRRAGIWILAMVAAAGVPTASCVATVSDPAGERAGAPSADAVSGALREAWQGARLNIVESAEQMPEADYGFRPVDSVRTVSELLTHIAGANYVFCSAARGEASPNAEDAFEGNVTARDEIIRVLGESMAYCDAAYDAATDATLGQTIALPFDGGDGPRAQALLGNVQHLNEHYGNLVTYFRIRGQVPPSSRR